MTVFVPAVASGSAAKVTIPVDEFNVYVPSPEITTIPSASHVVVFGVYKQVAPAFKPAAAEARPLAPVRVVNETESPGFTDLV